jgi:hypothetical protein
MSLTATLYWCKRLVSRSDHFTSAEEYPVGGWARPRKKMKFFATAQELNPDPSSMQSVSYRLCAVSFRVTRRTLNMLWFCIKIAYVVYVGKVLILHADHYLEERQRNASNDIFVWIIPMHMKIRNSCLMLWRFLRSWVMNLQSSLYVTFKWRWII